MTESKKRFRKILQENWKNLSEQELNSVTEDTVKTILLSREWVNAEIILSYLSFEKEISLDALLSPAADAGKKVFVPLITGKGSMDFHRLKDFSSLNLNRWGIREPSPDTELFVPGHGRNVLVLTPGLGFSSDGRRMGRGGGFYDRFLSLKTDNMLSMGICWDGVLREDIPSEGFDRPVDLVCCRNRIIRPGAS